MHPTQCSSCWHSRSAPASLLSDVSGTCTCTPNYIPLHFPVLHSKNLTDHSPRPSQELCGTDKASFRFWGPRYASLFLPFNSQQLVHRPRPTQPQVAGKVVPCPVPTTRTAGWQASRCPPRSARPAQVRSGGGGGARGGGRWGAARGRGAVPRWARLSQLGGGAAHLAPASRPAASVPPRAPARPDASGRFRPLLSARPLILAKPAWEDDGSARKK